MPTLSETGKKRYMQKINHGRNRIGSIEVWLRQGVPEADTKTLLAIEEACQEAIEVSTDMLAMMLKDKSIPPIDDYSNITRASEMGIIPRKLAEILREANGLRNRLIHVYNDLDIEVLLDSIKRILPGLAYFLEVIEQWLRM